MPTVSIGVETETERGWSYAVRILGPDGTTADHTVTLAWVDHDHWSGGARPPSQVVELLLNILLERGSPSLPARFDASTARRWHPDLDAEMTRRLTA